MTQEVNERLHGSSQETRVFLASPSKQLDGNTYKHWLVAPSMMEKFFQNLREVMFINQKIDDFQFLDFAVEFLNLYNCELTVVFPEQFRVEESNLMEHAEHKKLRLRSYVKETCQDSNQFLNSGDLGKIQKNVGEGQNDRRVGQFEQALTLVE
jgi:hypothetical protein